MATKRATEPTPTEPGQPAPTLATVVEARTEARAKAAIADPAGSLRQTVEGWVAEARQEIVDINADLRVARLELKAAEAMLATLGPVPAVGVAPAASKPKLSASLKAAARATGRKHVE